MSDQRRASGWHIIRWAEALYIENILIENVPEYIKWGPLDEQGNAVKNKQGKTFLAFLAALESLDYNVDYRILNCADYGDPTIRKRLFIQARKKAFPSWPEPTHASRKVIARKEQGLFEDNRLPYRGVREIIDWTVQSKSIYTRTKPLVPNTLRRINTGLWRFGIKPFVLGQQSGGAPKNTDDPLPTICSEGAISMIEPFLVTADGPVGQGRNPHSIDEPVPTIIADPRLALTDAFLVPVNHGVDVRAHELADPLPTLTAKGGLAVIEPKLRLLEFPISAKALGDQQEGAEPFIVQMQGSGSVTKMDASASSIDDPLPPVMPTGRHSALVEPVLLRGETSDNICIDESDNVPLWVGGKGHSGASATPFRLAQKLTVAQKLTNSYIISLKGTDENQIDTTAHQMDEPVPAITAGGGHIGVVDPYLVEYHGASYEGGDRARGVDEPLPAVATFNQFGVVDPYLVEFHSNGEPSPADEPLPTITTKDRVGLVTAQLQAETETAHQLPAGLRPLNLDRPLSIVDENGDLAEPLKFVDARGKVWMLDILFRMLQPYELAAAMSFPKDYQFSGNRGDQVRQIGNAVPVNTAAALVGTMI